MKLKKLKKIQSRHITIIKDYPKICLSQKEIFILGSSDSGSDSESEIEEYFEHKKISKINKSSKSNKKNLNIIVICIVIIVVNYVLFVYQAVK